MKQILLTKLRDSNTSIEEFRSSTSKLAMLLAMELVEHLPTEKRPIQTPMAETQGTFLKNELMFIPILRAGLSLLFPFLELFPHARVGFFGMRRDEETAEPKQYYQNLPPISEREEVVILDPMLATGGSALLAIRQLIASGIKEDKITLVSVVGSKPGVELLRKELPRVRMLVAVVDPSLDERKFIVPGLGDFGDRYFGTES